jgi:LacI family transcriptional regulator
MPKVILRLDTSRACGRGILLGVAAYCRMHGPWQLRQQPPSYIYPGSDRVSWPENWTAQGIIVSGPEVPRQVMESGVPIIGIDVRQPMANMPNIIGDAHEIADMAAAHFLERGFRNFAYCGFQGIRWAVERGDCFIKRLSEFGHSVHTFDQSGPGDEVSWENKLPLLADWMINLPRPLGLFACNDDCAQFVMQASRMAGVRVPEDIAVLGVDNDEMVCSLCDPPLSSLALDFTRAGYEAAALLDEMMLHRKNVHGQQILLKATHVNTRQSTDTLAVSDRAVAHAVRFIHAHARDRFQVNDVAEAVGISRRALESRFRKILGFSINHKIERVRTEQIARMLIEMDLTVSQIANLLGFTDSQHIARFFRRIKGLSPQAFRQAYGRK